MIFSFLKQIVISSFIVPVPWEALLPAEAPLRHGLLHVRLFPDRPWDRVPVTCMNSHAPGAARQGTVPGKTRSAHEAKTVKAHYLISFVAP